MKKLCRIAILLLSFTCLFSVCFGCVQQVPRAPYCNITYYIDGESYTDECPTGLTISMPDPPQDTDRFFDGWYLGDKKITEDIIVEEDLVIVGKFFDLVSNVEDFQYTVNNQEISITKYIGNDKCVKVPDTIENLPVTTLCSKAFDNDNVLQIILPQGLYTIELEAISAYNSLQKLSLPAVTKYLVNVFGSEGFYYDQEKNPTNLKDVHILGKGVPEGYFYEWKNIENIEIDTLQNIDSYTFAYCSALKTLKYGTDSVIENIGIGAFQDCESLYYFGDRSQTSSDFYNAENLYAVIPDCNFYGGTIEDYAFENCSSLIGVTINNTWTKLGNYCFSNCQNLTSVSLSDEITVIPESAFQGCSSLNNINIPREIKTISKSSFSGCSSLRTINIPRSVKLIESYAFGGCSSLFKVTFEEITDWRIKDQYNSIN